VFFCIKDCNSILATEIRMNKIKYIKKLIIRTCNSILIENILDCVAQCKVEDRLTSPRIASCNALKKTESTIDTDSEWKSK
jgi:hypothetical protein